jgi:hypothetical protein
VQPVASSSRIVEKPVEEVIESASSKKAKSKARRTSEAEQLQAEERLSVPVAAEDEDDEDSEAEVEDDEDTELVHEAAVKGKAKQKKVKAQKYVPENESKEDRDRRTIFVGNLPLEVAKSKVSVSCSAGIPLIGSLGSLSFGPIFSLSHLEPRLSRLVCVRYPLPRRQLRRRTRKRRVRGGPRGRRSEREHGRSSRSC